MNNFPSFLASGGPMLGFLIFLGVIAINAVLASAKVGQKSQKLPNSQSKPPPYAPRPSMPFITIGSEVAARRARMLSTDPRPAPPQSLQQALASAIQDAQNARRARVAAKSSPRPQQPKQKSPGKSKATSPPPLRKAAAVASVAQAPLATVGGKAAIAASQIRSTADAAKTTTNAVDASALRRWLTPRTLSQQFILTEVLQPPVALRE